MSKTTAPEAHKTTKLRPHRGDPRRMNAGDLRETVLARVDGIRGEVIQHVQAALERNNNLAHEVKEFAKFRESIDKRLFDFARRIAEIEANIKGAIVTHTKQQMEAAGIVEPTQEEPPRIPMPAPLPAWRKETRAAADKIEKELPALCTLQELATYFGVSWGQIRNLALRGRLRVIREEGNGDGRVHFQIPREALCEYVRIYGVPHPKRLFYGSSGIREYPQEAEDGIEQGRAVGRRH